MQPNVQVLESRLNALMSYPAVPHAHAQQLADVVRSGDDWACWRINPLRYAAAHGLTDEEAISLLLHATRAGLFDFNFNMLCPGCGGIEYSLLTMDQVPRDRFRCVVCARDVTAHLDDSVEVSFTVAVPVRQLTLGPFENGDAYRRFFFSANVERSTELVAFVDSILQGFALVPADGSVTLPLQAAPGGEYRILSIDHHAEARLTAAAAPAPTPSGALAEVDIVPGSMSPARQAIAPGALSVRVHNRTHHRVGVMLALSDQVTLEDILTRFPNTKHPFLAAKRLLNNQVFRDLFRATTLRSDLRLALRSLTLLFTDLKGSTELYDRTGDIEAYAFVQDHFRVLGDAVRRHHGAIVKTMGDAIMATFNQPSDAARASVDMMKGMEALEAGLRGAGHVTGLKIGLHEGPALAVNAEDRLDYFGQSVNVAARVQALAQAGEICATAEVMSAPGVQSVLGEAGWRGAPETVSLKGVGTPTLVHRLRAPG